MRGPILIFLTLKYAINNTKNSSILGEKIKTIFDVKISAKITTPLGHVSTCPTQKVGISISKGDNLPLADREPVESGFFECPYRQSMHHRNLTTSARRRGSFLFFGIRRCTISFLKFEFYILYICT